MKRIMKINSAFLCGRIGHIHGSRRTEHGSTASQLLQVYPKNLARQNVGANLLEYNPSTKAYEPTEAAAAWLDDDVATGWPAMTGHQDYLLAFPEPQLVDSFSISARSVAGTASIYAGDEAAPPTSKSWTLLEKNVRPIESINEKMGESFGRFAKYILIETDLTESGPWYSLYLYGEKPSTAYHIQQRAQPVDPPHGLRPLHQPADELQPLQPVCPLTRGLLRRRGCGDRGRKQLMTTRRPVP